MNWSFCFPLWDMSNKEMQGSRVRFFNAEINHTILMHRPHPESYIKGGTLKAIKQNLKEAGLL